MHRAGLTALLATTILPWPLQWASGRAAPPEYSRSCAERALAAAIRADASRWAVPHLQDAEKILQSARLEFRRQELRFYLRRDFGVARDRFRAAEAAALATVVVARRNHERERGAVRRALDRARCTVGLTDRLARAFRFQDGTVATMPVAKFHLEEAGQLWREEKYDRALVLCERAAAAAQSARRRMAEEVARFVDPTLMRRWQDDRASIIRRSADDSQPVLIANKDEGTLALFENGRLSAVYDAEFGLNQMVRKLRAGDRATPEGIYRVTVKRSEGETRYHKALELSYPNEEDMLRLRALSSELRLPAGTEPGSLIEIHGEGGRGRDWTHGCISLRNEAIDDLFARLPVGTPVAIVGADGGAGRFGRLAIFLASSGVEDACAGD